MSTFISIAALNEGMLERTCREALATATGPVRIGVCIQGSGTVPDDQRITVHHEPGPVGMGKARWIAAGFYDNEDYWLQTDGHMYDWQHGWDEALAIQLNRLGNAALTSFPPDDSVGALADVDRYLVLEPAHVMLREENTEHMRWLPMVPAGHAPLHRDTPMPYAIGAMLFTAGRYARDARPDPHVHQSSEESVQSLRLWTRGVDFYHPNRHVFRHANKAKRGHTPVAPAVDTADDDRSRAYFLGDPPSGMLGTVRTRESYYDHLGIRDPILDNSSRENMLSVRSEQRLPRDGRGVEGDFTRLEEIMKDVFRPDEPTYDVNSVQGEAFNEWTYTEGLCALQIFTQSVAVNARLISEAINYTGGDGEAARRVAKRIGDKWAGLTDISVGDGLFTFFPPGNNLLFHVTNTDNVLRAFDADPRWKLKPHPITSHGAVQEMVRQFGQDRVYDRQASGMDILRQSSVVGTTTASEMGLVGFLLDKKVVDFSSFEHEGRGRYQPIYKAIRESAVIPKSAIGRIMDCPWSGVVPLETDSDEAAKRFAAYKKKTLELRAAGARS